MRIVPAALLLSTLVGCASPRYLARVNDEEITGKLIRQEFSRNHRSMEKTLGAEADVQKYLDRVVDRRLLLQEGYRIGIHEDPAIQTDVARVRAVKMRESFLAEELDAKAKVSDAEVRAIYDWYTERLEIRQIVARTREDAEAIRAELVAGADFEGLARQRSIAQSSRWGGLSQMGWGTDEAREKAVYGLKDGEPSVVFKSDDGWEVARIEKRVPVKKPFFEDAAPKIREVLETRRRNARAEELYSGLWKKFEAQVQDCAPTLEALRAAKEKQDATVCGSWRGGALTATDVAEKVNVEQLAQLPAEDYPALRKSLVEDLVNREVIMLEAAERGYASRPEVADATRLKEEELTEKKLFTDHVIRGVDVSDHEARTYYEAHLGEFLTPAEYELAQIVVDTEERAREVQDKLAKRQPFEELARTYSTDERNAAQGGYAGKISEKALEKQFAAVKTLGDGEISAPIKTPVGYHVVKMIQSFPAQQRPFAAVKEDAREKVKAQKYEDARKRWVAKLRKAATVKVSKAGIRAYKKEQIALLDADRIERDRITKEKADVAARRAAWQAERAAEAAKAAAEVAPTDGAAVAPGATAPAAPGPVESVPTPTASVPAAPAPAAK
jgi:parvulin-like peptidyl-prolyl isomerase